MAKERLDKALASVGCGSRKEVGLIIKSGRVSVNGQIVKDPSLRVTPAEDKLTLDSKDLHWKIGRYYMLNKPPDLVSACVDNLHETVLSVFPKEQRRGLFPVGRLDKNTEGLLIITDDGGFCHALMSPRRHVSKVYEALVDGKLDLNAPEKFKKGLILADSTICLPAELVILGEENGLTRIRVTLHEGKHHQVKRMVAAVGGHVEYLKRISVGSLKLDETLKIGEYRELTDDEVNMLKNEAKANDTKKK